MITTVNVMNSFITSHSYNCECVCVGGGEDIEDLLSQQISGLQNITDNYSPDAVR